MLPCGEQRFLPCNEIAVMDGNPETFYPLPYGMFFDTVSTCNGVDDILDTGTLNGVWIRFLYFQLDAAAQREQCAYCGLCLVNQAFPIFKQRATLDGSSRLEPYNGDSRALPQVYFAILRNGLLWRETQCFRDVIKVFGVQKDILPVEAAFPTLVAVKAEPALCADAHLIEVLGDVLFDPF